MFIVSAVMFFISILMYGFSLGHGKITYTLFALLGLLFLALAGCTWGWLPVRRQPPA